MTCKDCKHYQKTQLQEVDLQPYIGKGYTLEEILKLSKNDITRLLWDCPYANDWCDADDPINWLCENKFERRENEDYR